MRSLFHLLLRPSLVLVFGLTVFTADPQPAHAQEPDLLEVLLSSDWYFGSRNHPFKAIDHPAVYIRFFEFANKQGVPDGLRGCMWVFQSHEPYLDRLGKKDYGVSTHVRYGYWTLGDKPMVMRNRPVLPSLAMTYSGIPLRIQTGQFLHQAAEFPAGAKRVNPQFGVSVAPDEIKNARPPVLISKLDAFKEPFLRDATFIFWKLSLRELRIASTDNNLYNIMHLTAAGNPIRDVPASSYGRVISGYLKALDNRKPVLNQMMDLLSSPEGKELRDRFHMKKEAHLAAARGLLGGAAAPATNPAGEFKKLTSADGKFTVEARIVAYSSGTAKLEKRDGKTIQVPIGKFDQDSQAMIRAWIKADRKSPPKQAGPPPKQAGPPPNPVKEAQPQPQPMPPQKKFNARDAARERIEAAVAAGRMTKEQAQAKLKVLDRQTDKKR